MGTIDDIFRHLSNSLQERGEVEEKSKLFSMQTKDADRVHIASHLLKEIGVLPFNALYEANKSLERSVELRNSGNAEFQKKKDDAALRLYTKSIATAPFPSENTGSEITTDALALAFANRSAVFFATESYELCLQDICQALKYNYPSKLLYKIFERQGKCLQYLGRIEDALESVDNALKWVSSATGLTEEKKCIVEKDLQNLLKQLQNTNSCKKPVPEKRLPLPSCSYNKNSEMLCASDCVELKYSIEMGRYISATRDIKPGDILAVEKPFASVLLPLYYETHCYNCLQRSKALLPCRFCSTVMFCSEDCRASSWKNNHNVDCPILATLQKLEIGKMGFLALRILILVSKDRNLKNAVLAMESEASCEERNRGFTNDGYYSSSEYGPIYWLIGNTEKRSVGDLFKRAVIAACILETITNLFNGDEGYKHIAGGLLLRHLQNLPCNAHEVSELVKTRVENITEGMPMWESIEIGAGAYAILSLVNHSCDPNVVRHSYKGDTAVLRAIRPIAKGDQVLDNYGYHYALHDLSERKSHLETQYYFTCNCYACNENWPTYDLLPISNPTYICSRCKHTLLASVANSTAKKSGTCTNCKTAYNMTDIINRINKSSEEFLENIQQVISGEGSDWNELAQTLIEHLLILDGNIQRPWKEYNDCQEAIKQCYVMTANCYKP